MKKMPHSQSVAFILVVMMLVAATPLLGVVWLYSGSPAVRFFATAWVVIAAVGAGCYGFFIIDGAFARIRNFAKNIRSGKLTERLYPSRARQIALLYRDLNQMVSSIQRKMGVLIDASSEQDAILGTMVEGVIAIDPEGRVRRVNAAARRLLDITTLLVEGRLVEEVIHRADIQRHISEALKGGEGYSATVSVPGPTPRVLEFHASGLIGGGKIAPGTMVVIHDITRIDKLENIRRDFVANVSHELRTPITSIKGFAETLLDGAMDEPESLLKFLRIIGRQAERLHSIFNDLLTLAKLEAGGEGAMIDLEPKSLAELVKAAVAECEYRGAEKNMLISAEVSKESFVLANSSMIEQALVNLIDNAIKYSEPGGPIRIEASIGMEFTEIAVIDQGPGIEKAHVPRLFERFYRIDRGRSRQLGGTGLGLAIVKHIVQAHGGRVELQSVVGQGSRFSIFLKSAG